MRRIMVPVMLALGGCATLPAAPPAPAEPVGLTIKSWGKPLFEWTLTPAGEGVFTYADSGPTKQFNDYVLKTKRISVGRDGYARIAALLAPARRYAGGKLPCERSITDMPYGAIRWGEGAGLDVAYDLGCHSKATKPVHQGLTRAQDLMQSWADAVPAVDAAPGKQE